MQNGRIGSPQWQTLVQCQTQASRERGVTLCAYFCALSPRDMSKFPMSARSTPRYFRSTFTSIGGTARSDPSDRSADRPTRAIDRKPSAQVSTSLRSHAAVSPKSAEAQRMQRQDSLAPPDSQPQPAVGTKPVSRGLSTIVPLSRHGTARPAIYNGQEARNSMRHMTGGMHEMTHARCATGTIRRAECKGQQT